MSKIQRIVHDKHYDVQQVTYLRSLTSTPDIVNPVVKYKTLNSVISRFASFLIKPCPLCSTRLIDSSGSLNQLNASCGNCGWDSSFVR